LRLAIAEIVSPLHVEIKNHLSMVAHSNGRERVKKSLSEMERDVLHELIAGHSLYQGREEELTRLAISIRDLVIKGDVEDDELLALLGEEL
jgi:exonuclease SbcD